MNNLNDGVAWGVVPLFLAANGASVSAIGLVAGLYPAVWGIAQIGTGAWSDRAGRKPLIVSGMLLQAAALGVLERSQVRSWWPPSPPCCSGRHRTRLSDADRGDLRPGAPDWSGSYDRRVSLLRDMGYVVGGLIAGVAADVVSFAGAIGV